VTDRRRRIWVTRTRPGGDQTATLLIAQGFAPIVAPVLAARPIPGAAIDLTGVDAIAFTSGHAVTAFAALSDVRALRAFAVGEATGEAARRVGFDAVTVGHGGAHALARVIAAAEPPPAKVFIPNVAEPAADLVALLAEAGIAAAQTAVYETVPTGEAVPLDDVDAILIHSARAGRLVADDLAGKPQCARIIACVISEAAAAPLRGLGLKAIEVAAVPSELALLALLA